MKIVGVEVMGLNHERERFRVGTFRRMQGSLKLMQLDIELLAMRNPSN